VKQAPRFTADYVRQCLTGCWENDCYKTATASYLRSAFTRLEVTVITLDGD
jgi:hypothetical protein